MELKSNHGLAFKYETQHGSLNGVGMGAKPWLWNFALTLRKSNRCVFTNVIKSSANTLQAAYAFARTAWFWLQMEGGMFQGHWRRGSWRTEHWTPTFEANVRIFERRLEPKKHILCVQAVLDIYRDWFLSKIEHTVKPKLQPTNDNHHFVALLSLFIT